MAARKISTELLKRQIKEKTKGYYIVDSDKFGKLGNGDHIKYLTNDGKFRDGGYIWFKKKSKNNGRMFWMISPSPIINFNTFHYILFWDRIKVLWKRIDHETELLRDSIDLKQSYINDIAAFLLLKYGDEFKHFMNKRELERQKEKKIRKV